MTFIEEDKAATAMILISNDINKIFPFLTQMNYGKNIQS